MLKPRLTSYRQFKKETLHDPEIKKEYDALEEQFSLAEKIIQKRLEKGLTQQQLAEKVHTKQSAIARLESGSYNPSLHFLSKVAHALESKIIISFP